jgi:hypothetical protein
VKGNALRSDALAGAALLGLPVMDVLYAMRSDPEESERLLDAAIECTFPASDPIAVHNALQDACEREASLRAAVSGALRGSYAGCAPVGK